MDSIITSLKITPRNGQIGKKIYCFSPPYACFHRQKQHQVWQAQTHSHASFNLTSMSNRTSMTIQALCIASEVHHFTSPALHSLRPARSLLLSYPTMCYDCMCLYTQVCPHTQLGTDLRGSSSPTTCSEAPSKNPQTTTVSFLPAYLQ